MRSLNEVDKYIENVPQETQVKLRAIRLAISEVAPEAKEHISYGMPFYDYKGRLAYFALQSKHIGLYIPPPIIEQHKAELKAYKTTKSAIQFPLEKDLPIPLIKKLVQARLKWNEQTQKK